MIKTKKTKRPDKRVSPLRWVATVIFDDCVKHCSGKMQVLFK